MIEFTSETLRNQKKQFSVQNRKKTILQMTRKQGSIGFKEGAGLASFF